MLSALKSQRVSMQILMPFIGFLPFLSFIIVPGSDLTFVHNVQGISYNLFRGALAESPNLLIIGSYILVITFSSFLFVVNIRFEILGQRSVILSYLYLFLVCTPMANIYLHPAGIGGLLLFGGLLFLFGIYHSEKPLPRILNAGILFGIATLIYPPFLIFFPVFCLAIARMKQPAGRDFAVIIIGFIIPVWLYGTQLFLHDKLGYEWISLKQWFEIRHTWPPALPGNSKLHLIWIIWLLLMLPMTIAVARSRKDVGRRMVSVLVQFLWLGPLIFILFEKVSYEIWGLVCLPLAVLFSMAIMNSRSRWLSVILIVPVILFLLWFQIDRLL